LMPNCFASKEAAMQLVESVMVGTTATGFPRRSGSSCCSTEAK
jgi:hypothetical protein